MQPPVVYNDGAETSFSPGLSGNPEGDVTYNYDLSTNNFTNSQQVVSQAFFEPPSPVTPVPMMPQYSNWNYNNANPSLTLPPQTFYPAYNSYFNQQIIPPTSSYWYSMMCNPNFPMPLPAIKTEPKHPKFQEWQRQILEKRYEKEPYCKQPERIKLAAAAGLTEYQVKIWFQNKRAKDKKKSTGILPPEGNKN